LTKLKDVEVPAELERIVRKAMAKDPDERYQSARDMLIDLRALNVSSSQGSQDSYASASSRRTPVATIAAVAALVVVLAGGAWYLASRRAQTSSIRQPSAANVPVNPPAAVVGRTLTYWITVEEFRDGRYKPAYNLRSEISFEARDRIRLNVRSPQAGFLYVLNEGPREPNGVSQYVVSFPSATSNRGSAAIAADQKLQIPETSWLIFDKEQGVERLWVVFADEPVLEVERAKGFVNPKGLITDATQNKIVQDFLVSQSATKTEAEKGDNDTTLKSGGKLLVYPIRLEHH
jgi:hypothetical protein